MFRRLGTATILIAAVMLAALPVTAGPATVPQAKAALGPLQAVTLAAADFHPATDSSSFQSAGYYLRGDGGHIARIPFPAEAVVIASVKVRVFDFYGLGEMCASLYRARPGDGAEDDWGTACTSGFAAADPQTLSLTAFKRVGRYHTAYLWVWFDSNSADLRLYGATVYYRVVT